MVTAKWRSSNRQNSFGNEVVTAKRRGNSLEVIALIMLQTIHCKGGGMYYSNVMGLTPRGGKQNHNKKK